jgi:apolipoprotein N-acyltransferase
LHAPGRRNFPVPNAARIPAYSAERHSYRPLEVGGYRLSADVCYEDILPSHIRDLMGAVAPGAARPNAMVNITNDS